MRPRDRASHWHGDSQAGISESGVGSPPPHHDRPGPMLACRGRAVRRTPSLTVRLDPHWQADRDSDSESVSPQSFTGISPPPAWLVATRSRRPGALSISISISPSMVMTRIARASGPDRDAGAEPAQV